MQVNTTRWIFLLFIILVIGCGESPNRQELASEPVQEPIEEISIEIPVEIMPPDSSFHGRIRYEDDSPYIGKIRAVQESGVYYSDTNATGHFKIFLMGDERFIFGARSPYGDEVYYEYNTSLVVHAYKDSGAHNCPEELFLEECFENPELK